MLGDSPCVKILRIVQGLTVCLQMRRRFLLFYGRLSMWVQRVEITQASRYTTNLLNKLCAPLRIRGPFLKKIDCIRADHFPCCVEIKGALRSTTLVDLFPHLFHAVVNHLRRKASYLLSFILGYDRNASRLFAGRLRM